ncbi:MAG: SpoIIE family protein phosphatase [Streptomycetaceae bacterium]|nr:SpoIIE family protein phosphatase [Streptomycetaceae bacterium]
MTSQRRPRNRPQSDLGSVEPAVVATDGAGIVTEWSRGAEGLLGYAPADVVGRPLGFLLTGRLPDMAPLSVLAAGGGWSGRLSLRHLDGDVVPVSATVRAPSDGVLGACWLLVRTETAAPKQPSVAELIKWAVDQGPFPLAIHGRDLGYVWVSDRLRRMYGLPGDGEVLGRRVRDFVPEIGQVEDTMRRVLRTGQPSSYNLRFTPPGESDPLALSVSYLPVRDTEGQVQAVCAYLLDTTERYWARRWLAMLGEADMRVGTSLDVTRTAAELTELIVPQFADLAVVDLLDSVLRGDEPTQTQSLPRNAVALRRVAYQVVGIGEPQSAVPLGEAVTYPEHSPPARCITTGRGVLSGTEDEDAEFLRWVSECPRRTAGRDLLALGSVIAVPLRARGTILGVLICLRRRSERFTESDRKVAEELAARAALSLDNALRYTRERNTAVALQRSLLPSNLPEQAAVEVATQYLPYLPTDFRMGVGGDWFDVIPLSGCRVGLVVGDVVGHGVRASAIMARLRGAVRTLADVEMPPDELLTHLDDIVMQLSTEADGDGEVGATCLYAAYDPVSQRCTMAAAGHPPPVVVLPDGTAQIVELSPGPPLGLGWLPFECTEVVLPESSMLVLFTNGLIESRECDVDIGLDRLCRSLILPVRSLETICDAVLKAMLSAPPTDDVALLIARTHALGPDEVRTWDVPVDPATVASARAHAVDCLAAWGIDDDSFTSELIISELVTNAIRYGIPPITLRLIRDTVTSTLICEVADSSSTAPHLRRARVLDEGGRGLMLVAQLSRRWGSRQTATGKTIWSEQSIGHSAQR